MKQNQFHDIFPLCVCMLSRFSRAQLFETLWTVASRLLCPWDSPGKNIGVGCHFLLWGIFWTQGSNMHLLQLRHCRQILSPLSYLGSPINKAIIRGNEIEGVSVCVSQRKDAYQTDNNGYLRGCLLRWWVELHCILPNCFNIL